MHASVGDRLDVHGNVVGQPGKSGEIIEVHGAGGEPPYLVRYDDGHTSLIFPGPDAVIAPGRRGKSARKPASKSPAKAGASASRTRAAHR